MVWVLGVFECTFFNPLEKLMLSEDDSIAPFIQEIIHPIENLALLEAPPTCFDVSIPTTEFYLISDAPMSILVDLADHLTHGDEIGYQFSVVILGLDQIGDAIRMNPAIHDGGYDSLPNNQGSNLEPDHLNPTSTR